MKIDKDILKYKWKSEPCHVGEGCWCRMISAEGWVDEDGEIDAGAIAHAGCLEQKVAEYIVDLHNKSLSSDVKTKET